MKVVKALEHNGQMFKRGDKCFIIFHKGGFIFDGYVSISSIDEYSVTVYYGELGGYTVRLDGIKTLSKCDDDILYLNKTIK